MKKKIFAVLALAILLALSMAPAAWAATVASGECGAEGDNVTWVLDDTGTLTISGQGAMKNYSHHESETSIIFDDSPWNSSNISNNITKIIIQNGITNLGDNAFSRCENLNSLSVSDTVTRIGLNTFNSCTNLNNIVLPDNIKMIAGSTFRDCKSLSQIKLSNSLSEIYSGTFSGCQNLKEIIIPDSVKRIRNNAFYGCSSLNSITIPVNVTTIDGYAFHSCVNLTSVYLPANINFIGTGAFADCANIKDVYYMGTQAEWDKINIRDDNDPLLNANIHYLGDGDKPNIPPDEDDKPTSDINNPEVFLQQSTSDWCTYASAAMMLRRRAILDNVSDWQSITDQNVRNYSYVSGVGMSNGYSYRGMYVECEGVSKRADKKAYFIRIMQEYPEGIVVYNCGKGGRWHAVLLSDYDAQTDTFYCVDPASNMIGKGRMPLSQSSIIKSNPAANQTQDMVLDYITSIWFISGNNNKKVLTSTDIQSNCPIEMQVTIGTELLNSAGLSGTATNSVGDILMTANGSGIDRNVKVTIPGSYVIGENVDVELQGTDNGSMVFTVTHTYSDNTQETQTFENVPVSATTVAKTNSIYPQSSIVLNVIDKSKPEVENIWAANPNETVKTPAPVVEDDRYDYYKITFDTDGGTLVNKTNPDYVIKGETYKMPTANKSRYKLTAWAIGAKDSENKVKANDVYTFTADTTVYAIWQYNGGGGGGSSRPGTSGGTTTPTKPGTTTEKPGNTGNNGGTGKNTVTAANINNVFADVQNNAWYSAAVAYVYNNGIMNGTEKGFEPNATTTRAMLVTMLYRLENEPAAGATKFSDVSAGQWFSNAIAWASANGVVNGYENGKFGPNDMITREQLAAVLYRFAQFKGYDVSVKGSLSNFSDSGSVSDWAQEAMQWAVGAGIINGDNGALKPAGNATRAEVAMMLMRFCENVAK